MKQIVTVTINFEIEGLNAEEANISLCFEPIKQTWNEQPQDKPLC